jgi:hypothetical protein
MTEINSQRIEVPMLHFNVSMFSFIFTAKKFLEAARVVVAHEDQQTDGKWHPVGKQLACQSIELSFKAFLTYKGAQVSEAEDFGHRIAELLAAARKQNLREFVKLTGPELAEIKKASKYYEAHVFRYPSTPEIVAGYPNDPEVVPLLSAASRLVESLYYEIRRAA